MCGNTMELVTAKCCKRKLFSVTGADLWLTGELFRDVGQVAATVETEGEWWLVKSDEEL